MKKHVLSGALFATTCLTSPALAQSINDTVPPQRQNLDANFVDRATGSVYYPHPALTIGPVGRGGLSVTGMSGFNGNNSDNGGAPGGAGTNWGLAIYATGSTYTVGLGQAGDTFTLSGSQFTSNAGSGATLSRTPSGSSYTYTYVAADGTRIVFDNLFASIFETNSGIKAARATKITYPTGEVVTLTWTSGRFCTNEADACAGGTYQSRVRLQSVSSSLGYQLQYNYAQDTTSGGPSDASFFNQLLGIQAINTKKDACAPGAGSCAVPNQPDRRMQVAKSASNLNNQFTDPEGRVTTFTNNASQLGVQTPGHGSANIVYTLDTSGAVTRVVRDGLTYIYNQSVSGTVRTVQVTDPLSHTSSTTADTAQFQLLTSKDERGYTTTNTWDPTTHLLSKTSFPEGNTVEYQYDGRGNITTTTLRAKNGTDTIATSAVYPSTCANALTCNQPQSTTDANQKTTNYTYDPTHGGIVTVTRPAVDNGQGSTVSPVTTYSYGQPNGQAVWRPSTVSTCRTQASCAGGSDEVHTWYSNFDDNLNVTGMHVGSGNRTLEVVTTATFDAAGNQLTGTDANGNTVRTLFNKDREAVGTIGTDPDGLGTGNWAKAQRISRDGHGWVSKVEEGTAPGQSDSDWSSFSSHREVDFQYDDAGRKIRQTLRAGSTNYAETQFSYDGDGRLDCTAVRMNPGAFGSTTSACDWVTDTSGPFGADRIGRNEYDAADEVTRVWSGYRSPQARPEDATYTPNGKVQTRLDGKGNRTGYVYDGFDRPFQTFYPSPTTAGASSSTDYEQLGYDANGNVVSRRLRNGSTISYAYDALNRLTGKTLPTGNANLNSSFSYDILGRLTLATNSNAVYNTSVAFTYDALGRKLSEANGLNGSTKVKTMQYDLGGRRTRLDWGDGLSLTYDYDAANEMTAIRENGATSGVGVLARFAYDDDGRRLSLTRGNGAVTGYSYDPVSRLTSLSQDFTGTADDLTLTFGGYNPAGQITSRTSSNDLYAYPAAANGTSGYTPDGLDRYKPTAGGLTGDYDPRGNMATLGSQTFSYSAENELALINGSSRLYYDALHRLVYSTSSSTRFDWDGDMMTTMYDVSGNLVRRFAHGPGADEPLVWYEGSGTADRRFLHADERGSVIATSNLSGQRANVLAYDEYGVPKTGNSGRFQYTGQLWLPELGMYYYKARVYAPSIGRFMQTDPAGYADGMNWYNYAHNDSVNLRDPNGAESRPLTKGEAEFKSNLFNGFLDQTPTRMDAAGSLSNFRAMTWGDTIYLGTIQYQSDISKLNYNGALSTFSHELFHQFQVSTGLQSTASLAINQVIHGFGESIYNYDNSKGFFQNNPEAQAQAFQACVGGGGCAPFYNSSTDTLTAYEKISVGNGAITVTTTDSSTNITKTTVIPVAPGSGSGCDPVKHICPK